VDVQESATFTAWLARVRNPTEKAAIAARVQRLAFGNPGDVKPVGGGVSELRIRKGPGYRISFTRSHEAFIILLCAGDKGSQRRDIATPRRLARELKDQPDAP
jgi:putative addiction module killer protein